MTPEFNAQAHSGLAPFSFDFHRLPPAEPVPFQTVPMNLSADEIRRMVQDLLG